MAEGDNNYIVGAGKLYFAAYDPGTKNPGPERYLGNTTGIQRSIAIDKLDHYGSDYAKKVKDATVDLQQDDTGQFTTDNVDLDNLGLWFGGNKLSNVQAAAAAVTDTIVTTQSILGRWFQLGKTDAAPWGARKAGAITSIKVAADEAGLAAADALDPTDYTADLDKARVFIKYEADGVTDADRAVEITFSLLADNRTIVIQNGTQLEGELRYIADNRHGDNHDYLWPDAKLTANGDYALKGDTWAELQFNLEILKKDDATETQYIIPQSADAA